LFSDPRYSGKMSFKADPKKRRRNRIFGTISQGKFMEYLQVFFFSNNNANNNNNNNNNDNNNNNNILQGKYSTGLHSLDV